jgi:uncharacterized LabA/DUF88 family protein
MRLRKTKNVTDSLGNFAFIDNQNLNLGVQKLGWKMDWRKFRKFLKDKYNVDNAYMFIGHMPEHEDMYLQLHDAGYLIVLKPTFDMSKPQRPEAKVEQDNDKDKTEEKKIIKGNVDAELVLWAVKEIPNYNKAVIISGDGDFYRLVEYLEAEKKLLKLLAPNSQYSSLYNKYEKYIDRLDKQKSILAYRHTKKVKPKEKI